MESVTMRTRILSFFSIVCPLLLSQIREADGPLERTHLYYRMEAY